MNSTKVNENIMKSLQTIFYYVVFVFYLFKKSFGTFIPLFMAVLGPCCCMRPLLWCGMQELLFVAMHGLLTVAASLVVEHGL